MGDNERDRKETRGERLTIRLVRRPEPDERVELERRALNLQHSIILTSAVSSTTRTEHRDADLPVPRTHDILRQAKSRTSDNGTDVFVYGERERERGQLTASFRKPWWYTGVPMCVC